MAIRRLILVLLFLPMIGYSQVKIPISGLPTATSISGADYFILNQGTTTKKITFSIISDSINSDISDSLKIVMLNALADVDTTGLNAGESLVWNGTSWINDSISGSSVTLGTANQVPFMNGATDFQYSDNFKWNGNALEIVADSGNYNVFVGKDAAKSITKGNGNTFIGYNAGYYNTVGVSNDFFGLEAGYSCDSCETNIFIGSQSGYNVTNAVGNIFLGYQSGYNETGSNKLYIENSNSATPLIWGDFANDSVRINGTLAINGDVKYENTFYDDLNLSGTALALAAQSPTLRTFLSGIMQYGYNYQTADDSQFGQAQLSHKYKKGTDLLAHVHLAIETNGSAGDTAVFALEYTWADMGETFHTTDTITVKIPLASAIAKRHFYYDLGDIIGTGKEESSCVLIRFTRLQSSASDTYNNWVYLLNLDFHYQIDKPGSYNETP